MADSGQAPSVATALQPLQYPPKSQTLIQETRKEYLLEQRFSTKYQGIKKPARGRFLIEL
jgi:hypothetical protein